MTEYKKLAIVGSMTALIGAGAYLLAKQNFISKGTYHESCEEHNLRLVDKKRMLDILEDLRIELTPYYIHFYNLLKTLENEYT